jgi:plasmid stabilization system protein ParE
MKQYTVDITEEALVDMEQIYNYIAVKLQAPENAKEQYNRIAESILKLDKMPERYTVIDSEPEMLSKIQIMPVDNYSIFYVVKGNRVIVTNVLYSSSDIRVRLRK